MKAAGIISERRKEAVPPEVAEAGLDGLLARLEARCNDLILALTLAQEREEIETRRAARIRRRLDSEAAQE